MQRERDEAGADAHLEHAAPAPELGDQELGRGPCEILGVPAGLVVELRRAVEPDGPAHRTRVTSAIGRAERASHGQFWVGSTGIDRIRS